MGLLDFFKSKNQKNINICMDDLFYVLEKVANISYKNFLDSFSLSKRNFGEATKFEAFIAGLFYIDFSMANEKINKNTRIDFIELAFDMIENKFFKKLANNDLQEIIFYRFTGYSSLTKKIGKEWAESFYNLYEVNLKGTKDTDTVEKVPEIYAEDFFEYFPKKIVFIRDETGNFIKTMKLIKEIFSGKDLSMIIKEIEILDLKAKKEFQK